VGQLLVCLLLLGAGLGLLSWLDLRSGSSQAPPEPLPAPVVEPPRETAQGLTTGGPVQFTLFGKESERRVLTGRSADSRSVNGMDVLDDVVLELFDPETDALELRVRARTARMRRMPSEGRLEPVWERELELEDVEVEALAGMPLAPLTFRSDRATVDVRAEGARTIRSDTPFSARSPELLIEGEGVVVELDAERLEIPRGGRVELRRAGAPPATFTARDDGGLVVRRPRPSSTRPAAPRSSCT
jgi:hypothetical protein